MYHPEPSTFVFLYAAAMVFGFMLNDCYKKQKLERLEEELSDLQWEVSNMKDLSDLQREVSNMTEARDLSD